MEKAKALATGPVAVLRRTSRAVLPGVSRAAARSGFRVPVIQPCPAASRSPAQAECAAAQPTSVNGPVGHASAAFPVATSYAAAPHTS